MDTLALFVTGILYFIFGIILGSAANALIDRLPKNISWVKGRSVCDSCRHNLSWKDLLPVVSYVVLGGKCRYCHSPIPVRNLLVELIIGTGTVIIMSQAVSVMMGLILTGIWVVTGIVAVMDWETKLVSETMVIVWAILVVIAQLLNGDLGVNFGGNLFGLGLGLLIIGGIWAGSKGRAMGFGDVEIAAVMGWWLGGQKMLVALWVAFVVGAVVGLIKMINKQAKLKSEIAFGPFLVIGAWVAFFGGDLIWSVWGYQ